MLKEFFRHWRDKAISRQFAQGWDWAAGELLRGQDPEDLHIAIDNGFFGEQRDSPLELGATSALETWAARETLAEQDLGNMRLMTSCTCGGPGEVTDYG